MAWRKVTTVRNVPRRSIGAALAALSFVPPHLAQESAQYPLGAIGSVLRLVRWAAGRLPVYYGRKLVAYVDDPDDLPEARFVERDGRLMAVLNA